MTESKVILQILEGLNKNSGEFVQGWDAVINGALCLRGGAQLIVAIHSLTTNLPMRGENVASLKKSLENGTRKVWGTYEVSCDGSKKHCPLGDKCVIANGIRYRDLVTDFNQ